MRNNRLFNKMQTNTAFLVNSPIKLFASLVLYVPGPTAAEKPNALHTILFSKALETWQQFALSVLSEAHRRLTKWNLPHPNRPVCCQAHGG